MVLGHHHRRGQTVMCSFQVSYSAWSHSHSSCTHKKNTQNVTQVYYTYRSFRLWICNWPDAVVIRIDVIRLVELSIMQAGAQISCHAFSRVAQVLSSRTKTALLAHPLPVTAHLSARQSAACPVTCTTTGLVHLASSALQLWQNQIRGGLGIYAQLNHAFICNK